jgi:hypothetical protein
MPKLDPDVHALRIDLDAIRSQGPRFRYPPQLRLRVVSFARQRLRLGHSFWASAKLLSVAFTSLQKWLVEFPDQPSFLPVVLRPDAGPVASSLALLLPGGARVEGLSLDDVAALCRKVAS